MKKAIKIIYTMQSRLDYLFLLNFFEFTGFFVGEENTSASSFEEERRNDVCFDAFIYAGEFDEADKKILSRTSVSFQEVRKDVLLNYNIPEDIILTQIQNHSLLYLLLENCISRIDELDISKFKRLIQLYVDSNLMLNASNLVFFQNRYSFAVEDARSAFLETYTALLKEQEKDGVGINRYLDYAILWCAVNVNNACKSAQKVIYFDENSLAGRIKRLVQDYSTADAPFSKAQVLLGLCYEAYQDKANATVNAYLEALDSIRTNCYSTDIYYRIAKRYEPYTQNRSDAFHYYSLSYGKKKKYKNMFKMGIYKRDESRNIESAKDAVKYFNEIIDRVENSLKSDYADPLEMEYAFKAYNQICYINYKLIEGVADMSPEIWKICEVVIENGKKAENIKNVKLKSNRFYSDFYGEKAEEYVQLSDERMSLDNIYKMLSIAYMKQQNKEQATLYLNKAEKK